MMPCHYRVNIYSVSLKKLVTPIANAKPKFERSKTPRNKHTLQNKKLAEFWRI